MPPFPPDDVPDADDELDPAPLDDSPQHELVVIRTFPNEIGARIAQLALEAHDIPAALIGDDAGGVHPALTFSHGVRLAVRHMDAVRALRVLDAPAPADETGQ